MAGTLVTPVCSVSPQGGGTCTYTATTGGTLPNLGSTEIGQYQSYKYTATPAAGATFAGFDITITGYYRDNPTSPATAYTTTNRFAGTQVGASWEYEPDITNWRTEWFEAGYAFWDGLSAYPNQLLGEVESISVVAVFNAPHTPTHLLVNSSTTENPAKLVYDPATNLLVADY